MYYNYDWLILHNNFLCTVTKVCQIFVQEHVFTFYDLNITQIIKTIKKIKLKYCSHTVIPTAANNNSRRLKKKYLDLKSYVNGMIVEEDRFVSRDVILLKENFSLSFELLLIFNFFLNSQSLQFLENLQKQ